jgi:hypothetical protein
MVKSQASGLAFLLDDRNDFNCWRCQIPLGGYRAAAACHFPSCAD